MRSRHLAIRGVIVGCVGAFFGALTAIATGAGMATIITRTVAFGIVTGAASYAVIYGLSNGVGAGFLAFLQPSGASCPAESQFSYQDALAAGGDVSAALASYEGLLEHASPQDVTVRLRAADLYAGAGRDAHRAAALYREVQRLPAASSSDYVYVTNRLIDLYLGDLADQGKAMGELRRLVDRYPTSAVGVHARTALAKLKSETGTGA